MAENIIALMFPEYNDTGNLVTSKDWVVDELYDDKTMGVQIKETGIFVDFFNDEECSMIYDSMNINAYLYAVNVLPECYPSRVRQLRSIFKQYGLKDWRRNRVSSETEEYGIHDETIKNEIRTEIATRIESTPANSYLIATNVFGDKGKTWDLKTKVSTFPVESLPMSISHVFEWLSNHHKPLRVYEWNEKHGENGIGAHKGNKGDEISLLLCSISHAEELLPKAIGEPMYDTLYCFDTEHDKYMEFQAGCKYAHLQPDAEERAYHSYHINDSSRVPKRVANKIQILQKLSE